MYLKNKNDSGQIPTSCPHPKATLGTEILSRAIKPQMVAALNSPRGGFCYRRISDQRGKRLFFDGISVWSPDFLLWKGGQGSCLGIGEVDGREGLFF